MKTTDDNFISDNHFEVLLRHALLEKEQLFNAQTLEAMANQTFSLINVASISETKGEAVIEKLTSDFKSGGSKFRPNIFLLSLFTLATIAAVIFFTSQKQKITTKINSIPVVTKDNTKFEPIPTILMDEINGNPLPRTNPLMAAIMDTAQKEDSFSMQQINNGDPYTIPTTIHIPEDKILHYEDIPTLTEIEKKQTEADKMKMLKDIVNDKRKVYTYVPAGTTKINDAFVSVQAFYIKSSEVTNLEYRTFLNDLLIAGNYDDYLIALPVKDGWKTVGIPEFDTVYFENIRYNNFPAVNMSRKGAELYCKWLTNEMNAAIDRKEIKGQKMYSDFFLPNNYWWTYAARGADTAALKFPWGKTIPDSVQNHNGCFLCNFNYTISKDQFAGKHICAGYQRLKQGGYHHSILTTAGLAIDTLVTCPVYSYNPNATGQYCMLGNVSEMVWTYDPSNPLMKGQARSMGGSWYSDVANVLIDAPEQYVGVTDGRAYIGFRPVWTFLAK